MSKRETLNFINKYNFYGKKGRQVKTTKGVAKKSNFVKNSNQPKNFVVVNNGLEFLESVAALSGSSEFVEDCVVNSMACFLILILLCQIRVNTASLGYNQTMVDQLPSFQVYKSRVIAGVPGRVVCALISVAETLKFLADDLIEATVSSYAEFQIKSCRPVQNGPSTFGSFIPYRMTQVHGTMQSCPASNVKAFGLPNGFEKWGLQEAFAFIRPKPVRDSVQNRVINICKGSLIKAVFRKTQ